MQQLVLVAQALRSAVLYAIAEKASHTPDYSYAIWDCAMQLPLHILIPDHPYYSVSHQALLPSRHPAMHVHAHLMLTHATNDIHCKCASLHSVPMAFLGYR